MVIDDLNVVGMTALKTETYAPLIVDANAPLPDSVALQLLQLVIGRNTQIFQIFRPIEHRELAQGHDLDIHETGNPLAIEQGFRVGALERRDHGLMLTNRVSIVKRYLQQETLASGKNLDGGRYFGHKAAVIQYQHGIVYIRFIGSRARVSKVLNRKRPLTMAVIRNLSKGLRISAEVLIQPYRTMKSAA
jgi:hypothetical protein